MTTAVAEVGRGSAVEALAATGSIEIEGVGMLALRSLHVIVR